MYVLIEEPDPEFRAMFVATVANIDWPKDSGLSTSVQQSQVMTRVE